MVKKIFNVFWAARRQFIKYFVIGFSAFILDVGSLYIFKEKFNLKPVYAVIINQIFIVNYVFLMNKYWSFKAGGIAHKQMVKFLVLAMANYAIAIFWMWLWHDVFDVHYMLARISNIILAVSWNFLLYKYWVYRQKEIESSDQNDALPPSP